jgi:hypothetical protein
VLAYDRQTCHWRVEIPQADVTVSHSLKAKVYLVATPAFALRLEAVRS